MQYQSLEFLLFLLIAALAVYKTKGKIQQTALLAFSVFFYAYGSVTYVPLFVFVILWTYFIGISVEKAKEKKKLVLAAGIIIALLPLAFYKYVPFAVSEIFGITEKTQFFFDLSMPIGISFFTFQSVGYMIDVYRGKLTAERDIVVYGLFVAFFPQIMSGPIGRAPDLIKQLKKEREFKYENVVIGIRTMAAGLFLKVFVADTLTYIVDNAYDNASNVSGVTLLIATLFFGIQIYCDFNGYTMMSRGVGKVLGIELINNFNHPYVSKSVSEFWRRWHISLSSWFKDYVYIPLGGNRCSTVRASLNLFITFLLSGLWHGANWTFIIWGGLNGLYLIVEKQLGLHKKDKKGAAAVLGWIYTYILINFSWIFFRADSLSAALNVIKRICVNTPMDIYGIITRTKALSQVINTGGLYMWKLGMSLVGIMAVILIARYETKKEDISVAIAKCHPAVRWAAYVLVMYCTLGFGAWGAVNEFIYFRF